ncbi:MAG: NTP transferase domain-containing protein [Acidobacteriota bacterium]|jgi:hypothetical protein
MSLSAPLNEDLKVLVLAGANFVPSGDLDEVSHRTAEETPLEAKSFVHIRGRLVIEYVLDWLGGAGLHRTWILAPQRCLDTIPERYAFEPIPQRPGASLAHNLSHAKEVVPLQAGEPVLVVFGDHPLTTVRALQDFLAYCAPRLHEADLYHGLALREAYLEYWPHFRRTSVLMREFSGRATGLNLMVPDRLHGIPAADQVYSVRKLERFGRFASMLARSIRLLGLSAPHAMLDAARCYIAKDFEKLAHRSGRLGVFGERAMRRLQRQVSVKRVERYAAKVFGAERGVHVVPLPHGGAAIDVDFADELDVMEANWEALQAIARRQDEASRARAASA